MMTIYEEIANVFNSDGKLLQIEYGLEAVNSGTPVVTVKSKNTIVCVAKRIAQDKFEEENQTSFHKVSNTCYVSLTGNQGDLDYVIRRIKTVASKKAFTFGIEIPPDILCRAFADKIQEHTRSSSERPSAFSASVFGFDGHKAMIYQTDISGALYPCYATAFGEKYSKMLKFVEKDYRENMDDKELLEISVGALLESIGTDSKCSEMEIAYLKPGNILYRLSEREADKVLQDIFEK